LVDLIPPFSNTLNRAKIEPLMISQEQLDELKAVLADPSLSYSHKSMMMRKLTGSCHSCGQMAMQIATYRKYGLTVIEKYCDECLRRTQYR
jgi:hypothetical protein